MLFCAALTLLFTGCGGNGGSSGGPPDTTGGPAFVITSPKDGASIAAPTFFAVQPFDPNQVASIQLEADGQPIEADAAGETSTRVFVLPEDYPAGALTLSARVTGNDGRTQSRSVTVQVESEPLTSTTVGPDGGVVGDREENGALSTATIPPGVAQGARVSIETRTQEEVTDETGVDYDALGVTFLGAQRVRSDTPIPATLQLSSGGFGNRVQPGQAVVNFLIRPDADGDGTDELTVINDASVAPNDAIVSDPPRSVLIGTGARIVSGLGIERLNTAQATPAAEPGMVIELEASGLPVASMFDVVTVVKSEVAPVADATLTLVAPDPNTPELQRASFVMPILPPGPATAYLVNTYSGEMSATVDLIVQPSDPPASAEDVITAEMASMIDEIEGIAELDEDTRRGAVADIETAQQAARDLFAIDPPEEGIITPLAQGAAYLANVRAARDVLVNEQALTPSSHGNCQYPFREDWDATLTTLGAIPISKGLKAGTKISLSLATLLANVTTAGYDLVKQQAGFGSGVEIAKSPLDAALAYLAFVNDSAKSAAYKAALAGWDAINLPAALYAVYVANSKYEEAFYDWRACISDEEAEHDVFYTDATCQPPSLAPPPTSGSNLRRQQQTFFVPVTGMGAAPPPGGEVCGFAQPGAGAAGGFGGASSHDESPIQITVYTRGEPLPFTGVVNAAGYFYVPFVPAGDPFTAVALDPRTGEAQSISGVGPETGRSQLLNFSFLTFEDRPVGITRFTAEPTSVSEGGEVRFSWLVSGEPPLSCTLDTDGDGTAEFTIIACNEDPRERTVTFDTPGTYTATLRATDGSGRVATATVDVVVAPATAPGGTWTRQFGTSDDDEGLAIAVGDDGHVFIAGYTEGELSGERTGLEDAFVRKLNADGATVWTHQFGTTTSDVGTGIAVDPNGDLIVIGRTAGDMAGTNAGSYDVFVRKLDRDGNERWTRQFGSAGFERAYAVAVDGGGNAVVVGLTPGDIEGANAGKWDAYVRKFDPDGAVLWTRQFGTEDDEIAHGVAIDANGNIVIAGRTDASLAGPNAGSTDGYVRMYDPDGTELWTNQFGTPGPDAARSVVVDGTGGFITAGSTFAAKGTLLVTRRHDGDGQELWAREIALANLDLNNIGVAVDTEGHIVVAASTRDALEGRNFGEWDVLVAKYDLDGTELWTRNIGTQFDDTSYGVATAGTNIVLVGATEGSLASPNAGGLDVFVTKQEP